MVKKSGNSRAMEEALQAAVSRMNGTPPVLPAPQATSMPNDPMSLFASVLPKLLERGSETDVDEDRLTDAIEQLRTDDLKPLREQLEAQTASIERILRSQKMLLRRLREVDEMVTLLAKQLSRIELLEEPDSMDPDELLERSGRPSSVVAAPGVRHRRRA